MFPSCGAAITWKYISIRFELVCLIRFFCSSLSRSPTCTVALFPWLAVSGERRQWQEDLCWERRGLTRSCCPWSPHGKSTFYLTRRARRKSCSAALLFLPHTSLLPGPCLFGGGKGPPSLDWTWTGNQLLWAQLTLNRTVGSFFFQRKIYSSNYYNLHLSFNIPAFFPQGFRHSSCQKGLLISPTLFALLASFIIFMFSIGFMYISFLWAPRRNWQGAGSRHLSAGEAKMLS